MLNSRRQFFSLLKDEIVERVQKGLNGFVPEKHHGKTDDMDTNRWRHFGKISDFPVGVTKRILFDEIEIVVVSEQEGIFAENPNHVRLPLCLIRGSILAVDLNGTWPQKALLSTLTSEMKLV